MSIISGNPLSGSTNGKLIKVTATSSPGTTLHAATATGFDELWIYCYNADVVQRTLTVQWGGTTSDDQLTFTVQPGQDKLVIQGPKRIQNSLLVKAFADAANVLYISGGYNNIG